MFELKASATQFLIDINLSQESRDQILSNFFVCGGTKLRTTMFIFVNGLVIWFVIKPILMVFPSGIYDQIMQIWIIIGWVLLGFLFTDLLMAGFQCTLLPKHLMELKSIPDPDMFHPDNNFGYSKYVEFSFKFYLLMLLFFGVYLVLSIAVLDPNQPHVNFHFKIEVSALVIWIGANFFCLCVFLYSLNFYKQRIMIIKRQEIAKITRMINDLIQLQKAEEYWKINQLMELRNKVIANKNTPINPDTVKKILFSMASFLISSILLPNIFFYLQTLTN